MLRYFYGLVCVLLIGSTYCFSISSDRSEITSESTTTFPLATTQNIKTENSNENAVANIDRKSRGMMMDDDYDFHDHDHDHDHHEEKEKPEMKAVASDPWAGYYDFIINEGSFKFWAAFQLVTAALLIYSAFAAVYYAKFNVITTDYDYDYDFFGRSNNDAPSSSLWSGLSSQTFQRIFDSLSSKKYS